MHDVPTPHDKLARSIPLDLVDRDRIAAALAFYLDRCDWSAPIDRAERDDYVRLLRFVNGEG